MGVSTTHPILSIWILIYCHTLRPGYLWYLLRNNDSHSWAWVPVVSSVSLSKQNNGLAELAICVRGKAYMLAKQTAATEYLEKPIAIITSLPLIPWKHIKGYRPEPMIKGSWYRMKTQIVIPGGRFDLELLSSFLSQISAVFRMSHRLQNSPYFYQG